MPPLERFPSVIEQDEFLVVVDAHIQRGKATSESCTRIDLREVAVHAHRDLVFKTNPLLDEVSEQNDQPKQDTTSMDWVDMFTSLCSCQSSSLSVVQRPRKHAAVGTTKNIMYPVARYPERLNSPQLVERRRKSLEKHSTFRPVLK